MSFSLLKIADVFKHDLPPVPQPKTNGAAAAQAVRAALQKQGAK